VHRWAVGSGSCLGVLAVVPGGRSLDHRSDPADWAPSVTLPWSVAGRGRRLSLAIPSFFGCGDAPRWRDRRRGW